MLQSVLKRVHTQPPPLAPPRPRSAVDDLRRVGSNAGSDGSSRPLTSTLRPTSSISSMSMSRANSEDSRADANETRTSEAQVVRELLGEMADEFVEVLRREPSTRSEQDIAVLMTLLPNIKLFANLPKSVLEAVARTARYARKEPQQSKVPGVSEKIILSQQGDHDVSTLFVILSGNVAVTRLRSAAKSRMISLGVSTRNLLRSMSARRLPAEDPSPDGKKVRSDTSPVGRSVSQESDANPTVRKIDSSPMGKRNASVAEDSDEASSPSWSASQESEFSPMPRPTSGSSDGGPSSRFLRKQESMSLKGPPQDHLHVLEPGDVVGEEAMLRFCESDSFFAEELGVPCGATFDARQKTATVAGKSAQLLSISDAATLEALAHARHEVHLLRPSCFFPCFEERSDLRSASDIQQICEALVSCRFFDGKVAPAALEQLAQTVEFVTASADELIFRQDEVADSVMLLLNGSVALFHKSEPDSDRGELGAECGRVSCVGGIFGTPGEGFVGASMDSCADMRAEFLPCRLFSARARAACDMLRVPAEAWSVFLRESGGRANGRQWIEVVQKERRSVGENKLLAGLLASFPLLEQLTLEVRTALAAKISVAEFSPLQLVTLQNSLHTDYGESVGFLLLSGTVHIHVQHPKDVVDVENFRVHCKQLQNFRGGYTSPQLTWDDHMKAIKEFFGPRVNTAGPGKVLGERSIFSGRSFPRTSTCVAMTKVVAMAMDGANFKELSIRGQGAIQYPERCAMILRFPLHERKGAELEQVAQSLANVSFFEQFPHRYLVELCSKMELRTYEPGQLLFRQDEPATHLLIVLSGLLSVHVLPASALHRRKHGHRRSKPITNHPPPTTTTTTTSPWMRPASAAGRGERGSAAAADALPASTPPSPRSNAGASTPPDPLGTPLSQGGIDRTSSAISRTASTFSRTASGDGDDGTDPPDESPDPGTARASSEEASPAGVERVEARGELGEGDGAKKLAIVFGHGVDLSQGMPRARSRARRLTQQLIAFGECTGLRMPGDVLGQSIFSVAKPRRASSVKAREKSAVILLSKEDLEPYKMFFERTNTFDAERMNTLMGLAPELRNEDDLYIIVRMLKQVSLLRGMDDPQLLAISRKMRLEKKQKGEMLFWEGDHIDALHFLLSGQVALCKQPGDYLLDMVEGEMPSSSVARERSKEKGGSQVQREASVDGEDAGIVTALVGAGNLIDSHTGGTSGGVQGLLSGKVTRSHSCQAWESSVVLIVSARELQQSMDDKKRQQVAEAHLFLAAIPPFKDCKPAHLNTLATTLQFLGQERGDLLFDQGAVAERVLFVQEGECSLFRNAVIAPHGSSARRAVARQGGRAGGVAGGFGAEVRRQAFSVTSVADSGVLGLDAVPVSGGIKGAAEGGDYVHTLGCVCLTKTRLLALKRADIGPDVLAKLEEYYAHVAERRKQAGAKASGLLTRALQIGEEEVTNPEEKIRQRKKVQTAHSRQRHAKALLNAASAPRQDQEEKQAGLGASAALHGLLQLRNYLRNKYGTVASAVQVMRTMHGEEVHEPLVKYLAEESRCGLASSDLLHAIAAVERHHTGMVTVAGLRALFHTEAAIGTAMEAIASHYPAPTPPGSQPPTPAKPEPAHLLSLFARSCGSAGPEGGAFTPPVLSPSPSPLKHRVNWHATEGEGEQAGGREEEEERAAGGGGGGESDADSLGAPRVWEESDGARRRRRAGGG